METTTTISCFVDVYKYLLLFETLGMNAVVKQFLNDSCENTQVIFLLLFFVRFNAIN